MHPSELLLLKTANINITKKYAIGGIKTKAGTDREIPLHDRILPLIQAKMGQQEKLIENEVKIYETFRQSFIRVMAVCGMEHTTHECRHTFATRMSEYAHEFSLERKLIIGHAVTNITDGTYTHLTIGHLHKSSESMP